MRLRVRCVYFTLIPLIPGDIPLVVHRLVGKLVDDRCGLYFLAAMDAGVVTIHAAQGALNRDREDAIRAIVAQCDPGLDVRIRLHSREELHAPDSLGSFAGRFHHAQILVDPTGAFDRVSKLLALAKLIRAEFGRSAGRILWGADAAGLVVLAAPREGESIDALRERLAALVDRRACPELRKVIRSVKLCEEMPAGRYTPVDALSVERPRTGFARLLLRVSGLAALVGLGTISAVHARIPPEEGGARVALPAITGLVGLTTLGETAHGARNRYQAAGGLKLYFGDAGGVLLAALGGQVPLPETMPTAATPQGALPPATEPDPKPLRVAASS